MTTSAPPEDWRRRGVLFNNAAEDYLGGRPGYPTEVFDILRDQCGLHGGSSVLEIGPGTGQATMAMLEAGARITAVEPGASLAETLIARTASRGVTTVVATFEDADLTGRQFDLVVSATAFHWVQPQLGFPKAAQLLRKGGWLVLWWTFWGDPSRPDPLQTALAPVLARKAPQLLVEGASPAHYILDADARRGEFALAAALGPPEQHLVSWTGRHNAAQTRALFATFSPWLALDVELREELLDDLQRLVDTEFNGLIERPYLTVIYRAERIA